MRSALAAVVSVGLLALPPLGADDKEHSKHHRDAFVPVRNAENRIAREIRHELVTLPYYGVFDDLAFDVNGGTVTLMGAVTRPVLKADAEKAAKKVEGVTDVVNNIEVLPPSPMDDQIRVAVYQAIYGQPALSTRYGFRSVPSIHIIVKGGRVTLEGVVANQSDRDLINVAVNGVPNVFSVTNNLQVEA